jgi:hypothetical protein
VVRKNRLTNTAKVIIVIGVSVLVLGGIFSIPSLGFNDQPDIGIFSDQYSISQNFVPFRTVGEPRTTITSSGAVVEAGTDFSNAIEIIQASEVLKIIKELPDNCGVKLFTTVVFEDDTTQSFSSGRSSFAPISTFALIGDQGQPIKRFETVPLLTCPTILTVNDERIGYIHQWLQGVNMKWEFVKEDGTKGVVNTASQGAGGTSSAPRCTPVVFDDIGDLAQTGLYTTAQIQKYKETHGNDEVSIFIASERAICATDPNGVVADPFIVTGQEIESRLGDISGKQFETTLTIVMTGGTIILEIPHISDQLGEPFIARTALDQFLSRQVLSFTVDNLVDTPPEEVTPPPTGIDRTIVTESFNPVKIDIADLSDADRTVTLRIKLNNYDSSEGVPQMIIKKTSIIGTLGQPVTAQINMQDAGVSGVSRIFEGKWIVNTGQSLGTYEVKVSMESRDNDVVKSVEVVQKAEDAPKETPTNGMCLSGQQLVEGDDGNDICVADCADNLKWDIVQQACAQSAVCREGLTLSTDEQGNPVCIDETTTPTSGECENGLTLNQNTMKCEAPTKTTTPTCEDNETLVNTGGVTYSCIPELPDFIKLLTPIVCSDKIGFTDEGFCLPATIVGLFQNPIQLVYVGIGLIILIVILKVVSNAITRQRGGIILNQ